MKQITLTLVFFILCFRVNAQVIAVSPIVLASTSYNSTGCQGLMINYTVGEMTAVNTAGNTAADHVTEGFEQPVDHAIEQLVSYPGCITSAEGVEIPAFYFNLFPNPTFNTCQVSFMAPESGEAEIVVTDITGRQLYKSQTTYTAGAANRQLNVNLLGAGNYLVTLRYTSIGNTIYQSVQLFSIIK